MKLLITVFLILSSSAFADYFTPLDGPGVTIEKMHFHDQGGVTLHISGAVQNLDNCAVTSRVHIPKDLPGLNNMLSASLMAYTMNKKIGLHVSGCESIPFWGSGGGLTPIVKNLWVFND
jgi:hypothetical protein